MLLAKKLWDCWNGVSDPSVNGFDETVGFVVVGGLELVEPKEPAGESKLPFSDVIVAIRISAFGQRCYAIVLVELISFFHLRVSGRRSGLLPFIPSGRKLDICGPRPK